ncbi:hypothetical protein PVAND_011146 [Polypedilum vanderplanki]|uniref:Uncharacterized protein n=1 Tax=Polypedilum vanderplanki TaxID=319348 RepID=A0A9J6CHQ5_POLVA|nr:hypothetical protein PVAND_011146 [Polypedilum vanderplanki]
MPPKRIVSSNSKLTKPPTLVKDNNEEIDIESELKFDNEVLWCISQFENLIKSGKINDAKKQESMKAIITLKKSTIPKIQKIQLMRQYFKDYKTKMQKDEETVTSSQKVHFESQPQLNGKFVKRKTENNSRSSNTAFLFNFDDDKLSNDMDEKLSLQ